MRLLAVTAVAVALTAIATAGCGLGAGAADEGSAELRVTRDHGARLVLEAATSDPPESETVIRFLDREAEIETEYGGNFVRSIEGVSGVEAQGRRSDWFFYVNGYWSPVGAGEARVRAGDRIWWDYRDWTDAYRVSAVVGSWPEPFLHGYDGELPPTEVVCTLAGRDAREACGEVAERLRSAGVEVREVERPARSAGADLALRILVGPWQRVRSDRVARALEGPPSRSGVYATVERCGPDFSLLALNERAEPVRAVYPGGWVAALQGEERQPTWIVSGSSAEDVAEAAGRLGEEELAGHYALAVAGDEGIRLPAEGEADPDLDPCPSPEAAG